MRKICSLLLAMWLTLVASSGVLAQDPGQFPAVDIYGAPIVFGERVELTFSEVSPELFAHNQGLRVSLRAAGYAFQGIREIGGALALFVEVWVRGPLCLGVVGVPPQTMESEAGRTYLDPYSGQEVFGVY